MMQILAVGLLVALALAYVLLRVRRAVRGGGCAHCASPCQARSGALLEPLKAAAKPACPHCSGGARPQDANGGGKRDGRGGA